MLFFEEEDEEEDQEGELRVQRVGVEGFRVWGLVFRFVVEFWVSEQRGYSNLPATLGFRVWGLGLSFYKAYR